MAETLFPVFDVPEIPAPAAAAERKCKPSVLFDFDSGDFVRDATGNMVETDGRTAYVQRCLKICMTERFACLSYGRDTGVDMIDAMGQKSCEAVQSAVERTVTEALMVDPETEYLRNFQFAWRDSKLYCSFILKGKDWAEVPLQFEVTA